MMLWKKLLIPTLNYKDRLEVLPFSLTQKSFLVITYIDIFLICCTMYLILLVILNFASEIMNIFMSCLSGNRGERKLLAKSY